ncbi:MAG: NAD-dependent epimerase/dehydratase family protein [Chitinophagaceae bacterium]
MKPILVTGASGFLGANLVKKLNAAGLTDIVIVDNYDEQKFKNLKKLSFTDYISYKQGVPSLRKALEKYSFSAIIHIGANADVLVRDADIMLEANYEHSKLYLELARAANIPLIYASSSAVYGNMPETKDLNKENPHNIYAWSKWLFDKHVTANMPSFTNRVVGLRLFNIFGIGEFHKGKNASLPFRFFSFIRDKGFIDIFDRQIERDYVWVEDVADVIIQILNDDSIPNGIYDLGGNNPVSHKTCAGIVAAAFVERKLKGPAEELIKSVPMPAELVDSFQFYTKANDLLPLIARQTTGNEEKIRKYIHQLLDLTYGTN